MALLPMVVIMRSFWADPYLWVHLAGIATVPIWLELCLLGLAVGYPTEPDWWLLFVGVVGIVPILWMQWQRPFSIFSLLLLALQSKHLTEEQRRILSLFKTPLHQILTVLTAILMAVVLWQLHRLIPMATGAAQILPVQRWTGLWIAAIAFLLANLFLQVPVSVLQILLTPAKALAAAAPYPVDRVPKDFTVPGIKVRQILPPLEKTTPAAAKPATTAVSLEETIEANNKASQAPIAQTPAVEPVLLEEAEPSEFTAAEEEWQEEESPQPPESTLRQTGPLIVDDAVVETIAPLADSSAVASIQDPTAEPEQPNEPEAIESDDLESAVNGFRETTSTLTDADLTDANSTAVESGVKDLPKQDMEPVEILEDQSVEEVIDVPIEPVQD